MGDILAVSIIEGIHGLFTFDLKIKPNYEEPWTMIFHDLKTQDGKNKYQYIDIAVLSLGKRWLREYSDGLAGIQSVNGFWYFQ